MAKINGGRFDDTFLIETKGFEELEKALLEIANDFGYTEAVKKVLIPSAKEAMHHTFTSVKQYIEMQGLIDTGEMLKSVRLTARKPNSKDKKSIYIQQGDAVIAEVSVKTDERAVSQEFGNARTPAKPFLRTALKFSSDAVVDTLETSLANKLTKYKGKT